jgi:hypothetical protein
MKLEGLVCSAVDADLDEIARPSLTPQLGIDA